MTRLFSNFVGHSRISKCQSVNTPILHSHPGSVLQMNEIVRKCVAGGTRITVNIFHNAMKWIELVKSIHL